MTGSLLAFGAGSDAHDSFIWLQDQVGKAVVWGTPVAGRVGVPYAEQLVALIVGHLESVKAACRLEEHNFHLFNLGWCRDILIFKTGLKHWI